MAESTVLSILPTTYTSIWSFKNRSLNLWIHTTWHKCRAFNPHFDSQKQIKSTNPLLLAMSFSKISKFGTSVHSDPPGLYQPFSLVQDSFMIGFNDWCELLQLSVRWDMSEPEMLVNYLKILFQLKVEGSTQKPNWY